MPLITSTLFRLATGIFAVACLLLSGIATVATAQSYPSKPVTFIVPFPPGDLEDILTRFIAEDFQAKYNVPTSVVNKPGGGAGPFPGAIEVAKAPADGYTVGSFIIAIPVVGPNIGIDELNPDPFDPIGIFLTYPFVIAAGADAPYDDIAGLAAHAQSNDVVLGHFGGGLIPTRVTFALAKKQGFAFSSDAAFDELTCNTLASGDADVINTTLQLVLPCKDDIKILASVGGDRISITPNTPTVSEIDSSLSLALWNGLFVRKETPQTIKDRIAAVARETMSSSRAQQIAQDTGALVYWQNQYQARRQIKADIVAFQKVIDILQ